MNHILLQTLNKDVSTPQIQHQQLKPLQQQAGTSNRVGSGVAFLMGDPVVREARMRLDSKKSFCDDHMFYPESKFGWSTVASNTNASAYIPVGVRSYGLSTYNQRVSQHTNLGGGVDISDTNSNGLAGPVPHNTRHVYTGQNFNSMEQHKQQQQVNPYLMSNNVQQSFNINDNQQSYYGRSMKNGSSNSNNNYNTSSLGGSHTINNKW
ncbi:hypothetical protein KDRO_B03980 [Kluyveromyces lactis]|nr:hypothetical protein KDRO_B03980 [Kluyveromyces lactis]